MNEHRHVKKTARLFRNGRSQAIRIPKEFEMDGEEVEIEKDDEGVLIIRPKGRSTLADLLGKLTPLEPDEWLPDIDDADLAPLDEPESDR